MRTLFLSVLVLVALTGCVAFAYDDDVGHSHRHSSTTVEID